MTPDLDARLETVITALKQVVLPALPATEVFAAEQATLCIGHLALLSEQYRHVSRYEVLCLADIAALGAALADIAVGGAATTLANDGLRRALRDATASARSRAGSASPAERRNTIARAIDELILAGSRDGTPDFRIGSRKLILAHGRRQSERDRAWFRGCGMDPEAASLPAIHDLVEVASNG